MSSEGPIGAHAVPAIDCGPSDLELVQRTRDGDSRAFGELWNRHSRAGRTVARSYALDPDDVVAESFAKVLQAIKGGGGPTAAFRPYLFSTIRNVAMQWRKGNIVDASDELDALADPSSEDTETLLALDKSLTAQAFRSLPTRWQEALWYSEVEQLSSQEISPLLGMTPNAVSALAFRAREGLRQAWIQAHLIRSANSDCAGVIEKLGSYTRGSLGPREIKRIQAHLETCPSCSIVEEEARDVGSRLALVLLPLAAGIAGALAYTVWLQGGSSASAATLTAGAATAPPPLTPAPRFEQAFTGHASPTAGSGSGTTPTAGHSSGGVASAAPLATAPLASTTAGNSSGGVVSGLPSAGVLVGIALAVAAAVGAAFVLGPIVGTTASGPMAQAGGAQSSDVGERLLNAEASAGTPKLSAAQRAAAAAGGPAGSAGSADGSGSGSGNGDAGGTSGTTATHSGNGAGAGSTSGGGSSAGTTAGGNPAAGTPAIGGPTTGTGVPADPTGPTVPGAPTTNPSSPDPTPTPTPTSTPDPTPTPTSPPATSTPDPVPTPTVTFRVDHNNRLYPVLSGTAEPGSTVEVVDQSIAAEPVVAQTSADTTTGSFALSDFPGLGFGSHQLAVREVSNDGRRSTPTPATGVVLDDVRILSPTQGTTLSNLSYFLAAAGDADALFEAFFNAIAVTSNALRLNSDGNFGGAFTMPQGVSAGPAIISVRYFDPSTGQFGPTRSITAVFDPNA